MTSTILVIEDEEGIAQLLQRLLEGAGYRVLVALDGETGYRMVLEERPDLVLLDIMLPGIDGWEVCRRIRQVSTVPILMLTAKTMTSDVVYGLELGADDYVTKPFEKDVLLARIRALLRRAGAPPATEQRVYRCGEIVLDLDQHTVTVAGRSIALTPLEFRLLSVMMRNPGRLLPHRYLLTQVWGPEYAEDIDNLKLYIHYLRRKIEPDPRHPRYILTEWGIGYRFNCE
ncbi:MAG: DNA-binding response regulator [Thermoflexus sp.]|uniref:response regulator transcription factor n=1 Tax=Thermoflexus sp. TaxID=1969742 RepID=UPI00332276F2